MPGIEYVGRSADVTDESKWITLAQNGDQTAFSRLVGAYQTPVYNLAYRMLGNKADAEDATQETFLRAYVHLRSYDSQRPFSSWLLSIASHYCIDRLRRRRMTWLSLEDEIVASDGTGEVTEIYLNNDVPNPESVIAQREQEMQIQRLLAALSPTDRAAMTLRYWYDYSYEEIAEVLNLTVSAVKSRLHRARRDLAHMLEEDM
ncbi:MAG: sigma-70 family RNA polymerase sigma factor [Anaerolineae bacterium]|nr:sigma-70 family RNA polymerase sigma factor [Anaerolineae bacterium]